MSREELMVKGCRASIALFGRVGGLVTLIVSFSSTLNKRTARLPDLCRQQLIDSGEACIRFATHLPVGIALCSRALSSHRRLVQQLLCNRQVASRLVEECHREAHFSVLLALSSQTYTEVILVCHCDDCCVFACGGLQCETFAYWLIAVCDLRRSTMQGVMGPSRLETQVWGCGSRVGMLLQCDFKQMPRRIGFASWFGEWLLEPLQPQ